MTKKFLCLVAVAVGMWFTGCKPSVDEGGGVEVSRSASGPIRTSDVVDGVRIAGELGRPAALVFVGGDWCDHSRGLRVYLNSSAVRDAAGNAVFVVQEVPVKPEGDLLDYLVSLNITEVPSVVVLKNGRETARITGARTRPSLVNFLQSNLDTNFEVLTGFEDALLKARSMGRPVLVEFTGSDWCPPCQRMHRDVFSNDEFKDFVSKNIVYVRVDFPRRQRLSRAQTEYNEALGNRFNVRVMPTYIVFDKDGNEIRRTTGVVPGGVRGFISWINGQ